MKRTIALIALLCGMIPAIARGADKTWFRGFVYHADGSHVSKEHISGRAEIYVTDRVGQVLYTREFGDKSQPPYGHEGEFVFELPAGELADDSLIKIFVTADGYENAKVAYLAANQMQVHISLGEKK
jgi:hypothetical protein